MYELLRSQQSDNQELVFFTFDWKIIRSTRSGLTFHSAQPNQCLLLNDDQGKR